MDRSLLVVTADDDAVGPHEVLHRRAFLEKFRVGNHHKRDVQTAFGQHGGDGVAHHVGSAHGYGGFVDHHPVRIHVPADHAGYGTDVLKIGGAVLVWRGADGDELEQAVSHARRKVGGKLQPAAGAITLDHVVETRLVNGDFAALEHGDLARVHVHAEDVVTHIGEAGTGDQPDVAGAKNRNFHVRPPTRVFYDPIRLFWAAPPVPFPMRGRADEAAAAPVEHRHRQPG